MTAPLVLLSVEVNVKAEMVGHELEDKTDLVVTTVAEDVGTLGRNTESLVWKPQIPPSFSTILSNLLLLWLLDSLVLLSVEVSLKLKAELVGLGMEDLVVTAGWKPKIPPFISSFLSNLPEPLPLLLNFEVLDTSADLN